MKLKFFIFALIFCLCSCTSLSRESPYRIRGEVQNIKGETGYGFSFHNRTEKEISSVELVLSLYDADGEPVFSEDWISVKVPFVVGAGEEAESFIILEEYIGGAEGNLFTDYFYASKIWYEDGSFWEDPFGRYAE